MTKNELEKLVDESSRCLYLMGRYRCQKCRYKDSPLRVSHDCANRLWGDLVQACRTMAAAEEDEECEDHA